MIKGFIEGGIYMIGRKMSIQKERKTVYKQWFQREKYFLLSALTIGFLITLSISSITKGYSKTIQSGLSEHVIRFHVVANSDAPEDQALKNQVRDAVLEEMKPLLEQSESIEETRGLLKNALPTIEEIAREVLASYQKDEEVQVTLGPSLFPTKRYGDVVLPSGEYEAVKIEIGEAIGQNWWCVMFPPLCFVDITHGVIPEASKEQLQNVLTAEEYQLVLGAENPEDIPIKVEFKIVEWLQEKKIETKQLFAKFW